jgi:D-lyxose ketol-isomerase
MKRSEINIHIADAIDFTRKMNFALPPFAFWSPEEWKNRGPEYDEIRENQLGWDLTDFGSGDYEKTGLLLFTIRNGNLHIPSCKKTYAEKVLLVTPKQITPCHYHKSKMEDIINRGGEGTLSIQVWGSLGHAQKKERAQRDEKSPVPVAVDGRNFSVPAGTVLELAPGESVTLFQRVYHQFWSDRAPLLLGEVSMVNDDHADNFFLENRGRFPSIEEDEPPRYLLTCDYGC